MSITIQHTQETLCLAHIYALPGTAGVNLELGRVHDYGVDGSFKPVVIRGNRRVESGFPIDFQAKSTYDWQLENGKIVYDRSIPDSLAPFFEVFTALNQLKRPVDMYFYPDDVHQPNHPQARLASIERNVDWYRFWLQGYERPNSEDPDQYKRWKHLRELRDADAKAADAKASGQ